MTSETKLILDRIDKLSEQILSFDEKLSAVESKLSEEIHQVRTAVVENVRRYRSSPGHV